MNPSSRFHSIQPAAQTQISPLQHFQYGYIYITLKRVIEEKSHPSTVLGRNIPVDIISENKYNLHMNPSSRFHSIQAAAQTQISPLHHFQYGYNCITHKRVIEEKSHPSTVLGRNIPVDIVSEDKYNLHQDPSSRFHRIQPAAKTQVSPLQHCY